MVVWISVRVRRGIGGSSWPYQLEPGSSAIGVGSEG
jgi:hypothetical protein